MTDKQMEEKKKEFFKGFVEPEYYNIDDELVPNGEYGEWLRDPDDVWLYIEELVEEVEREKEIKGFHQFIGFVRNYLDENYPEDIFNGSSGDSGAVLIAKIREALKN